MAVLTQPGATGRIGCRLGGHASCTAKPMALSTRPHSPLAVCRASGPCPLATSSNDAVQTFSVRTRSLTPCLNLGPARVTSATIIAMEEQGRVVDGDRVGRHRHDTNNRLRIRSPGSDQDSLDHPAGDKMWLPGRTMSRLPINRSTIPQLHAQAESDEGKVLVL